MPLVEPPTHPDRIAVDISDLEPEDFSGSHALKRCQPDHQPLAEVERSHDPGDVLRRQHELLAALLASLGCEQRDRRIPFDHSLAHGQRKNRPQTKPEMVDAAPCEDLRLLVQQSLKTFPINFGHQLRTKTPDKMDLNPELLIHSSRNLP